MSAATDDRPAAGTGDGQAADSLAGYAVLLRQVRTAFGVRYAEAVPICI